MCYWYADSTFQVLADIGNAEISMDIQNSYKMGSLIWGSTNFIAYTSVTRKSSPKTTSMDSESSDENFEKHLLEVQQKLVAKYDSKHYILDQEDLAQLSQAEYESFKQNGWNIEQYLRLIQEMPAHEKLLEDSIARASEVQEILTTVCYTSDISLLPIVYAMLTSAFLDSKWPGRARSRRETENRGKEVSGD